jgi:hypothetical protein
MFAQSSLRLHDPSQLTIDVQQRGRRMTGAKTLALVALGYVVSLVGGVAAVAVNEMLIPDDIQQSSGGMVAFGDMVLFVLVAGILSLAPTFVLLKLCVRKAPRALVAVLFLIAAIGPASWIAVWWMATGAAPGGQTRAVGDLTGLFIAFVAIPRMVLGPVLLAIESATFFMIGNRPARSILAAAMLMDIVPLVMFVLHFAAATHMS